LDSGESGEMLFDWRGGEIGDFTLNCEILTPTQLVSNDSFGGGVTSSDVVSWTEEPDEDSLPMVSILVAIVVAVLIIGMWLVRRSSQNEDEEEDYIQEIQ